MCEYNAKVTFNDEIGAVNKETKLDSYLRVEKKGAAAARSTCTSSRARLGVLCGCCGTGQRSPGAAALLRLRCHLQRAGGSSGALIPPGHCRRPTNPPKGIKNAFQRAKQVLRDTDKLA